MVCFVFDGLAKVPLMTPLVLVIESLSLLVSPTEFVTTFSLDVMLTPFVIINGKSPPSNVTVKSPGKPLPGTYRPPVRVAS